MPFTAFVADKLEPLSETRSFNRLDIGATEGKLLSTCKPRPVPSGCGCISCMRASNAILGSVLIPSLLS
jgi:hypothetical protein